MNDIKLNCTKKRKDIYKFICVLSFFSFIGCLSLQVVVSNNTALKGKDFKALYDKKRDLEKEIALLKYEESNLSSLDNIEKKALTMGFVPFTESLLSIVPPSLAAINAP